MTYRLATVVPIFALLCCLCGILVTQNKRYVNSIEHPRSEKKLDNDLDEPCSTVEQRSHFQAGFCTDYWALLRAAMPCARLGVDIGANKGYTAASWMSLWNPEVGISPDAWWKAEGKLDLGNGRVRIIGGATEGAKFGCGVCGDCKEQMVGNLTNHLAHMIGTDALNIATKGNELKCTPKMSIVSFDGQIVLNNITDIKQNGFPGAANLWDYRISAFSNQSGRTFFMQADGWEMAGIQEHESKQNAKIAVQTVDSWSESEERVDILKIDTEGHDLLVIAGALKTLSRKVTVLAFGAGHEQKAVGSPTLESIVKQLDTLNFKCYITTTDAKAPLLMTDCFYDIGKGIANVYCVHTIRGDRIHKTFAYLAKKALINANPSAINLQAA